jgi:DNA-binding MarR family transcriptional regulator
VAERLYGDDGKRAARRGVLRGLARYGAQTVPELARARSVTRQNVQPVVDALVASGLARLAPNPLHRRSLLVTITARGEQLVRAWDETDARVLSAVGRGLSRRDLETTARTLRLVRERFEMRLRWESALEPPGQGVVFLKPSIQVNTSWPAEPS